MVVYCAKFHSEKYPDLTYRRSKSIHTDLKNKIDNLPQIKSNFTENLDGFSDDFSKVLLKYLDKINQETYSRRENDNIDDPMMPILSDSISEHNTSILGFDSNLDLNEPSSPEYVLKCPTLESLSEIPKKCQKTVPKYFAVHKSTIQPLFMIHNGKAGPMAQTHGYRDFILASIQLRKALRITSFKPHFNDDKSAKQIPFGVRFDTSKLCGLVNLLPEATHLDSVLALSGVKHTDFGKYTWNEHIKNGNDPNLVESLENLGLIDNSTVFKVSHAHFSMFARGTYRNNPKSNEPTGFGYSDDLVHEFARKGYLSEQYEQNDKVIGMRAMRVYVETSSGMMIDEGGIWGGKGGVSGSRTSSRVNRLESGLKYGTDLDVVREIYRFTPSPRIAVDIVDIILNEFFGGAKNTFFGVHWRYNAGDYIKYSQFEQDNNNLQFRSFPHEISLHMKLVWLEPMHLFDLLIDHIEDNLKTSEKVLKPEEKVIFIATPDGGRKFENLAVKFQDSLRKYRTSNITLPSSLPIYRGWKIITTRQTTRFVSDKFKNQKSKYYCETFDTFFGEFIPIIEMEILKRSFGFYRSRPSNWSFNIQAQRFANAEVNEDGTAVLPLDRVVLDIFIEKSYRRMIEKTRNDDAHIHYIQIPKKYARILNMTLT